MYIGQPLVCTEAMEIHPANCGMTVLGVFPSSAVAFLSNLMVCVTQPKASAVSRGYITHNIHVNRMARQLEANIGK
jgi:MFS-type transporter involved in bile tolerance (Atg22 family)